MHLALGNTITTPAPVEERKGLLAHDLTCKDYVALYSDLKRLQTVVENDLPPVILREMQVALEGNSATAIWGLCRAFTLSAGAQVTPVKTRIVRSVAKVSLVNPAITPTVSCLFHLV